KYSQEDILSGISACARSLVEFSDRPFSSGTLESALFAIWGRLTGFRVVDKGGNRFQFFFDKNSDVLRIERGSPWLFKNFILHVKRWRDLDAIDAIDGRPAAALTTSSKFLDFQNTDSIVVEESKPIVRLTARFRQQERYHRACNQLKIPSIELGSFSLGIEILWLTNGCENIGVAMV
ncbi:hypothetical protein PIB30_100306, partial [Stylosanthes scabra]|nr:hypothetical protein [Stylosanthes scabra]